MKYDELYDEFLSRTTELDLLEDRISSAYRVELEEFLLLLEEGEEVDAKPGR